MSNIRKEQLDNQEVYLLENNQLRLWVCPSLGMNIYQVEFNQQMIVKFNEERYKNNMTHGIPILYPTPNRTRDFMYEFNGFTHHAQMHGYVKSHEFKVTKTVCEDDMVAIEGCLQFVQGEELYEKFPYESTLKIRIEAKNNQIHYTYEISNEDEKPLPYGFAIHPFFEKNEEEVTISVQADQVMEMTEEKLPTGQMIPAFDNEYDLHSMKPVSSLQLDHVYTNINGHPIARMEYSNLSIELDADPVFTHVVVFTPEQSFFCIENQTCSTDAVNVYNRGLKESSGLQIVAPHTAEVGKIVMRFIKK